MPVRHAYIRPAALALGVSAIALGLTACKVDSRPLLARNDAAYAAGAQPASYAYDVDALGLPYAQPAQLMPVDNIYDGYALAERAYAYDRAAYRAPPDYAFRYGEAEPWAWQLADNSLMFAEPYGDDYRTYYYEPGDTYPYFVRDDRYGYAYGDNGALMAVLDATGALLPNSQLSSLAGIAGRYLYRGQALRDVYYDAPHYAVAENVWIDRAPVLYAYQEPWIEVAQAQPVWRQYRVSTGEQFLRAFEPERARREVIAQRFDNRIDWGSAKAIRKQAKAERKFEREVVKEDRKAFREAAKDQRKFEREQARSAFVESRPASAVVRDHDDNGRRARGFRGEDRPLGGGERHDNRRADVPRPEVARNDAPHVPAFRAEEHGKHRGDDHGKGKGGDDHPKAHDGGGHGNGHDKGGGKGKGKD